jgi:DNA helicase-2/ATP-dependent DNA helicase PcrA
VTESSSAFAEFEKEYQKSTAARPEVIQAEPVKKSAFTPSPYQQAIYDWIRDGQGNAVVEAVAGSGKTTTMIEALRLTHGKVLFTAFNASIAAELQRRAPGHVRVATLHSLGLRALRRAYRDLEVDNGGTKVDAIVAAIWPETTERAGNIRTVAKKMLSLAKATLVDVADPSAIDQMVTRFGIECENDEDLDGIADELPGMIDACKANPRLIDFDDMVWLPVVLGLQSEKFDWVFVDEAQDMNRCQIELVMRALHQSSRVCCVGDRRQSIYGFRGADCEAIPGIIDRLGAQTFPLSITYRCPTKHVQLAQEIVPGIQARPDAPEGIIEHFRYLDGVGLMVEGDLVLCRTNAPLVKVAFALIRAGKKAIIRGRDIGTGLIALAKRVGGRGWQNMGVNEFLTRLERHETREMAKLVAAKKGAAAAALDDKIQTIRVLAEAVQTVRELVQKAEQLFSDGTVGVVCSSVHRAKGLESDRVFIVAVDLMPHPMAMQDWEIDQEMNIKYVALTRSKSEMYFVEAPPREKSRE